MKKKIRCLIVSSYFGPYAGNFISSLISLHREMKSRGHVVLFVFPRATEKFEWVKIIKKDTEKVFFIDFMPRSRQNIKAIGKLIKNQQIDIILSRMSGWDIVSRCSTHKPVIWQMEMSIDNSTKKRMIKNAIKYKVFGGKKTYHIAVSQPVSDQVNAYRVPNKCVAIPNAIDFSRLPKIIPDKNSDKTKRILIFGWSPIVKGLDIAIKAINKLFVSGETVKLLVSAQEQTYKYINKEYGTIPEWIELIPPTNNVSELYRRADIMLSASRMEGFSYSLAEAIYCGLPAVVSDIPGTAWSKDFAHVYSFRSENVDDLERIMRNVLQVQIEENDIQQNRELLNKKYSMRAWAESMANFIESSVE